MLWLKNSLLYPYKKIRYIAQSHSNILTTDKYLSTEE